MRTYANLRFACGLLKGTPFGTCLHAFRRGTEQCTNGRRSPFCSSSIEMLSGLRTKTMCPLHRGRLIVPPLFVKC